MTEYTIDGDTVPTEDREHFTPNVIVENPKHRRIAQYILSVAALALTGAIAVDGASAELDYAFITLPATALVLALSGALGLGVTIPNIPRSNR